MGYVSKDIAVITEPEVFTLAASPNFVTFGSKASVKTFLEYNLQVNSLYKEYGSYTWTNGGGYSVDSGAVVALASIARSTAVAIDPVVTPFIYVTAVPSATIGHIFYNAAMGYIGGFGTNSTSWVTPNLVKVAVPALARFVAFSWTTVAFSNTDKFKVSMDAVGAKTELRISEPTGILHIFRGTMEPTEAAGSVFYIAPDPSDTAENLRESLLDNTWIAANFDIRIPFVWIAATPTNGRTINIKSKGAGTDYNMTISAPGNTGNIAYVITPVHASSINNDSISGEESTAEIELDVYTSPDVFYGQDDRPTTSALLGTYAVSLQKTYAGAPVWFELNSLFSQYGGFKIPGTAPGWYDTGTLQVYRFVAKKKAANSFAFYQSAALFVVNGYGPASEQLDLNDYAYGGNMFKLLTNMPTATYIRGQRAYLNFIMKDAERGLTGPADYMLRVAYRAYSTSNVYMGIVYSHSIARTALKVVNTCVLNIDSVLATYPKAGYIRVTLMRDTAPLTNDLVYQIRPDCLHKLKQFTFLNRLGGWDVFNFDASQLEEIKPTSETYRKTITPGFVKGDSIETVYSTSLARTITIEGAPVTDEVARWLSELAAARVILDGDGNYIVLEDFTMRIAATSQDMQIPTIKYHLSETPTND